MLGGEKEWIGVSVDTTWKCIFTRSEGLRSVIRVGVREVGGICWGQGEGIRVG